MTVNGVMAIILRYSPNLVGFVANYVKVVDKPSTDDSEKCHKVHQLSTTDSLCSVR